MTLRRMARSPHSQRPRSRMSEGNEQLNEVGPYNVLVGAHIKATRHTGRNLLPDDTLTVIYARPERVERFSAHRKLLFFGPSNPQKIPYRAKEFSSVCASLAAGKSLDMDKAFCKLNFAPVLFPIACWAAPK